MIIKMTPAKWYRCFFRRLYSPKDGCGGPVPVRLNPNAINPRLYSWTSKNPPFEGFLTLTSLYKPEKGRLFRGKVKPHSHTHTHVKSLSHRYTHMCMHACIYACVYTYVYLLIQHARGRVCVCVCMYVRTYVCMYV